MSLLLVGCGGGAPSSPVSAVRNQFVANGTKASDGTVVNVSAAITPEEAMAAAILARPGTASKAELGDEDGVAAYDVHIVSADGTEYDVKVDAGTGKVFRIDNSENDGKNGENEDESESGQNEQTGSGDKGERDGGS